MNIIEEIEKILSQHECKCYTIDKDNYRLIYEASEECSTLNPVIAQITGLLLINNINYEMTKQNNIFIIRPSK